MGKWPFWQKITKWLVNRERSGKSGKPAPAARSRICSQCSKLTTVNRAICDYCQTPDSLPVTQILLRDESLATRSAWPVTVVFSLCVFLYMAGLAISMLDPNYQAPNQWWSPQTNALEILGANQPDLTLNRAEYWRLITALFLHRNLLHIGFNLGLFATFGIITFYNFGTRRFWLIMASCGLSGSVFSANSLFLGFTPFYATGFTSILFGFLGVHWIFLKKNNNHLMAEKVKSLLIWGHILFISLSLLNILPIDHLGHLGAMVTGIGLGYWFESEIATAWGTLVERGLLFLAGWLLAWGWYQVFLSVETLPF